MTIEIPLSKGFVALIDDEDEDLVRANGPWHSAPVLRTTYAGHMTSRRVQPRRLILMHRIILAAEKPFDVDHINHNGLDNRRANLRLATRSQNIANCRPRSLSGYLGVCRTPGRRFYYGRVDWQRQVFYTKGFLSAEDAARARDALAFQHFGEFAYLNFPRDDVTASTAHLTFPDTPSFRSQEP